MCTYLKDEVVTKIFTDPECEKFRNEFLSILLGIEKDYLKTNLTLVDIRLSQNKNLKNSISDILYETNDEIYNIEINYNKYKEVYIKNLTYMCHLILKQNLKGQTYSKLKPVTQININNYDLFKKGKFVYVSKLQETKYHLLRNNMIKVIDINLNYLKNKNFENLHERLEMMLYIFVCGDMKKVKKICKGDEAMEKVSERLQIFEEEFDNLLFYDRKELLERAAYNDAFEKGEKATQNAIVKKLLEYGMNAMEIKNITGIDIEGINKNGQ